MTSCMVIYMYYYMQPTTYWKNIAVLSGLLLAAGMVHAQKKKPVYQPEGDTSLQEVLITATKFPERKRNVVQKVDIVSKDFIKRVNTQNTGDLLQATGNVFVQKSQQGGSSPVIRGFEASRVLLVLDGVRMNNAIYRSGHLQNVITIDQNMLERVEVLYGPGSTLYGSDALGGVVAFKTKDPTLSKVAGKTVVSGNGFVRYTSANQEKTGHADVSIGGQKWGAIISATYSDFDDLRMGNNYPDKYPNFGRRSTYVQRINGVDSIVKNNDDRIQKFSGYQQWDVLGKLLYRPNDKQSHTLNIQLSNSSDVPRYDRLQDVRNGNLRFAEWYYGPQKRNLFSYTFDAQLKGFFNQLRITASYQDIEESRYQRDRNNLNRQNRIERVKVGGLYADLKKNWGRHELHTGIDLQLNDVRSRAFTLNINTGATGSLDTRYPEKNTYNSLGIYAQHLFKFTNDKWVLNDGIRVQSTWLNSTVIDNSTAFRPFTNLKQNPVGVSGNLGLVFIPVKNLRFNAGVATGFRSPNIDDLTKIFESSTASRQLVVPNPDIKPEKTISPELGINVKAGKWLRFDASVFYTWFKDAIVKDKFQVNGQDSTVYNGVKYQTLAAQNNAKAGLYGFNAAVTLVPAQGWELYSTINLTRGTYTRPNGTEVPLDHIPPVYGRTSLRYSSTVWSAEVWTMYNGWKKIKDYNPDGEDNAQYATADGMPSWATLNIRGQYQLSPKLSLQAALENITDRNYRVFASGFSAPGRSIIVSLRASF